MSERYSIERHPSREAWLRARSSYIGASDAAAVVGLSIWSSPYALWVHKTEPPVIEPLDELQEWGLRLEDPICEKLNEVIGDGREVRRSASFALCRTTDRPHVGCSLDAMTDSGEPVQLKTAHFGAGKIWAHECPLPYMCQCQYEIHVTGARRAYIAVLIDGYRFKFFKIERHQRFIDRLLRRVDHFWAEHVVKRVPPPTDYSQATRDALSRKFPTDNGAVVDLPVELEERIARAERYGALKKKLERRIDAIQNETRAAIGEASYARLPQGGLSWKANKNGTRALRRVKTVPETP